MDIGPCGPGWLGLKPSWQFSSAVGGTTQRTSHPHLNARPGTGVEATWSTCLAVTVSRIPKCKPLVQPPQMIHQLQKGGEMVIMSSRQFVCQKESQANAILWLITV